jgi:YesN/AraC family two-component response regulator
VNISSVYLSKLFNEQVGFGLPEYLNEVRLKCTLELWAQGGHELKDVIKMCGYLNYPYFFRVFKKKYGMTPKQYWESRK